MKIHKSFSRAFSVLCLPLLQMTVATASLYLYLKSMIFFSHGHYFLPQNPSNSVGGFFRSDVKIATLVLRLCIYAVPITEAVRSKVWTVSARSNAGVVGSNPNLGTDDCVLLFCFCTVLCVGSGIPTDWSPIQKVLLAVYRITKLKQSCRDNEDDLCGTYFSLRRHFV
jgi:hypothetical protein